MEIKDVVNKLPTHPTKKYIKRPITAITTTVVHHSLTVDLSGDKDIYAFARYHVNNHGWPGIGYHYVIDRDGTIYKTNYLTTKSYHVGNHNIYCIGVCLVGDFRTDDPTYIQYKSLYDLLENLVSTYSTEIKGHSEMPGYEWKQCPAINMDEIRKTLITRMEIKGYNTAKTDINSTGGGDKTTSPENKDLNLIQIIVSLIKSILSLFKRS